MPRSWLKGRALSRSPSRGDAEAWARAVGFSERQVPWVTSAAIFLKVGRHGGDVSAADVRQRLEVTAPAVFEETAQLSLLDDPL